MCCMDIQAHLKKLFAGIHSVEFGQEETEIVAMRSLDGEEVPLSRTVPITSDVEVRGRREKRERTSYVLHAPYTPLTSTAGVAE